MLPWVPYVTPTPVGPLSLADRIKDLLTHE